MVGRSASSINEAKRESQGKEQFVKRISERRDFQNFRKPLTRGQDVRAESFGKTIFSIKSQRADPTRA